METGGLTTNEARLRNGLSLINRIFDPLALRNMHMTDLTLKVVGNEKLGGSGVWLLLEYGTGPW